MSNEKRTKDYSHKFIFFSSHPATSGYDSKGFSTTGGGGDQYDALVVMADQAEKEIDLTKIEYRSMTAGIQKKFSDYDCGVFLPDEGNWKLIYKSGADECHERNQISNYALASTLLTRAVVRIVSKK